MDSRTVQAEYKVSATDPNRADLASARVVVSFDKPQFNHAGGGLAFGPDGMLYFTVGDGGSSNDNNFGQTGGASLRLTSARGNAQDLTKIFGKMHRIDPLGTNGPGGQYGIPATNPFANPTSGQRPEIYAYGLRNCWRFSFDSRPGGTGRLFAADVGQNAVEEVNIITSGGNYGWRNLEGNFAPAFSVDAPAMSLAPTGPIGQYAHPGVNTGSPALPQLGLSVTGGYVYRGSAIPALSGKYVFGDWSQSPILSPPPATPSAKGVMLGLEETSPGVWALARRALLGWNLATVPAGAVVASASVTLKMDRTIAPAYLFSLHKITTNWGEGTSNAASQEGDGAVASATDATWSKPFFGQATPWTNPGGDFETSKSATLSVGGSTNYTWTGPGLAADANAWLANPAGNFGWLLKADLESAVKTGTGASGQLAITVSDTDDLVAGMVVSGTGLGPGAKIAVGGINSSTNVLSLTAPNASAVSGTIYFAAPSAKRFASRSIALSTSRPRLVLTYVPVPALPSHRKAWELTSYLTGQFIEDTYDTDGDGIPDGVEYAWGFPPRTPNDPTAGFTVDPAGVSTGGPVVLTFRRDPLATDLTYRAQVSTDLSNWTDLATSAEGGAPSGIGFVSEAVVDTLFRNVTVHDNVPQGTARRLYRLKVIRL